MLQQPRPKPKEEFALVLDFLQHGYADDPRPIHRKEPIIQALGKSFFTLLELVPLPDTSFKAYDEVYIGEGKRDKIAYIKSALFSEKLTQTAKTEMPFIVQKIIEDNEPRFIEFINKSGPISLRSHQLEILPGIGKKHAEALIAERQKEPFKSFEDIKQRCPAISDIRKVLVQRILDELDNKDRYRLFVRA